LLLNQLKLMLTKSWALDSAPTPIIRAVDRSTVPLENGENVVATSEMTARYKPVAGDYWVIQSDGYIYLNPKEFFERKYGAPPDTSIQGIGWAIKQMREGSLVRRAGWNGKGMWLALIPDEHWGLGSGVPFDDGDIHAPKKLPWVGMRTADNSFVPWLASQADLLAFDWETVEKAW
jgi:hypothetical protein